MPVNRIEVKIVPTVLHPALFPFHKERRCIYVEENNDIAVKLAIRNVPTIIFYKDGEIIHRQVGAVAKTELEERLKAMA